MDRHFLSLIHGSNVHIAPQTKFLPAAVFSTLLTADSVLEKVKEDAENYKISVVAECEKLKEEAEKQGFEKGFQTWAEHVARLEQEIIDIRKDLEKVIVPVALKAAKKIVGKEIELSKDTVIDIVLNNLKAVAAHKKITIYVNKKDLSILEKNRQRLKDVFEHLEALSIREKDDIESGGCIIETEGGIINARLDNQWEIMESAFKGMIASQDKDKVLTKKMPKSKD